MHNTEGNVPNKIKHEQKRNRESCVERGHNKDEEKGEKRRAQTRSCMVRRGLKYVRTVLRGGWTSLTAAENTPVAELFLPPRVRTSVCVMTDVVPRCCPAEDGLKVH